LTIATCVPADPQSKGGSEATVRVAKADLVPTEHNLRPAYGSFAELEVACQEFMADVNTRPHRATMQPPVIRLAEEHERLTGCRSSRTPCVSGRHGRSTGSR